MTDKVKHSTSYFHEVLAKAFEMFKNGYEPVMETPFQPRRQGSAFVTEYKLVRESLDDVVNFDIDNMDKALQSDRIEIPHSLTMEQFDKFMEDHHLTLQQKWEAEEALNELAQQSQELGMYEVDREQVRVYSKNELDEMEWGEFKKLTDAVGIRGRRRQNLTRDYLIYQEENQKLIS